VAVAGAQTPLRTGEIAVGDYHSCALTSSERVKCWGFNRSGQLGDGTTMERHTPVLVGGGSTVSAIAAGNFHTCSLSIGYPECWGSNIDGALGDGTRTNKSTPGYVQKSSNGNTLSGIAAIAGGGWFTCVAANSGAAWCWGDGNEGQIGDGNFSDQLEAVRVRGRLGTVIAVAAGQYHACAVSFGGRTKCWGDNRFGQIGDGTTEDRSTPRLVKKLEDAVAIAAGDYHTCALTAAGGVKCWGRNFDGQLGDGTITDRHTPVFVKGLKSGVAAIAAGGFETCAITTAGGAKCWGDNSFGQLGDGTKTERHLPGFVKGLKSGVAAIATGTRHTCAMTDTGRVKCWGNNEFGQLGDGTTTERLTPVKVVGF
jgi:alpha-tubulin suppressor-like RCC1 family protein